MTKDLSRMTVVILVFLTLLISLAGTWLVRDRADLSQINVQKISGGSVGNVELTLVTPPVRQGASQGDITLTYRGVIP